ncbi:MAG: hypothetical protein OEZ59_12495, partial [Deltaproteobacteria bacterium]|nr:hypothetical protein [Deltaproteobacteria bacterium]
MFALCKGPEPLRALELYALQSPDCGEKVGLIVGADRDKVYLLELSGRLEVIGRRKVDRILVYNTHDNPVTSLDLA